MSSKKLFFILLATIIILAIGFIVIFLESTKILKSEGDELVKLKLTDEVLSEQQAGLMQAKKDIESYSDLETIAKSIIPQSKDQASTIAEISSMANQNGISLGSIDFPASALGQVSGKGSKSKSVDSSTSQLVELPDLKGVYIMEININSRSDGPVAYDQIINFLKLLESSRKTAQVTNIDIQPSSKSPGRFDFKITINTYVRPES